MKTPADFPDWTISWTPAALPGECGLWAWMLLQVMIPVAVIAAEHAIRHER
jgi:hypothetical protein